MKTELAKKEAHAQQGESSKALSYWKEEAQKNRKEAQKWKNACEEEWPSSEYINLVRDTTVENLKLKAKVEELQEFKDYAEKYKSEREKYITQLEGSIDDKITKLQAQRALPSYPEGEYFALEAEVSYEQDLLEQTRNLHENGPDIFRSTLKMTHENFRLKQ